MNKLINYDDKDDDKDDENETQFSFFRIVKNKIMPTKIPANFFCDSKYRFEVGV